MGETWKQRFYFSEPQIAFYHCVKKIGRLLLHNRQKATKQNVDCV
jgi:hypothetical protein